MTLDDFLAETRAEIAAQMSEGSLFAELARIFHKTGRISLNPLIKLGLRQ